MNEYSYIAYDEQGREVAGLMTARDEPEVRKELTTRRLFPARIGLASNSVPHVGSEGARVRRGSRQRIRPRELAVFVRQLATLLRAGLPLVRALEALARQERDPRRRQVVRDLMADIRSGLPLSAALGRRPGLFDRMEINLVKAGEAAGALAAVLERLAAFQEKSLALRRKVTAALVYPACILGVAGLILAALLVFVVPRFKLIFADLLKGAPLPALTQAVLLASETVRHHCGWIAVGVAGVAIAVRLLGRSARGRSWRDAALLRLPGLGDLLLKSLVAQWSRTLATLLASGVPVLSALAIARDSCRNARVADAVESVRAKVTGGSALAAPLEAAGVFPPVVASMVDVGEQTGQLPEMLGRVAEIFEGEVDAVVAGLGAAIEPLLIVALAVLVGTIVLALFLPILRVVQLLS